jgi:hypothetical protein
LEPVKKSSCSMYEIHFPTKLQEAARRVHLSV